MLFAETIIPTHRSRKQRLSF